MYSTILKLPDVYGVFKFVVDYHRPGLTHIISIDTVSFVYSVPAHIPIVVAVPSGFGSRRPYLNGDTQA